MQKSDIVQAFKRLGQRCESPVEIVIGGGAAMILAGYIDRDTGDSDAVWSNPKLSLLQHSIEEVAEELELKPDWLNDGIKAYADLLPNDFHMRCVAVGMFGNLTVQMLGRQDLR